MARKTKRVTVPTLALVDQLLRDLFDTPAQVDAPANPLAEPFAQWLTAKPFIAFAQNYLPKIRKKVHTSRDDEETYNLYCEIRTAYMLLQEPKFAVAYEPHASEQGRSADFAVTFRTHTVFHVEVTRLRLSAQEEQLTQSAASEAERAAQIDMIRFIERRKLVDVVCDKLGQLAPDTPNVLWVWSESQVLQTVEVGQVMRELKRRAEQRDPDLFARHRLEKPADFVRAFQLLSAIVVQSPHTRDGAPAYHIWRNNDARHALSTKIANLLAAVITTDTSPPYSPA